MISPITDPGSTTPRPGDESRHPNATFGDIVLAAAEETVLAGFRMDRFHRPVVGHGNDDGIVRDAKLLQQGKELANLRIHLLDAFGR